MAAVGVTSLIIIIISIHRLLFPPLFSQSEGVDSQLPCPLNHSLMSTGFLFNIKKERWGGEEKECVIVLMACNRLLSELEGATCKAHVRS